jgi:hypothetical protein
VSDILLRLRRETRHEHDAIERQLGLVDDTLSIGQYPNGTFRSLRVWCG